MNEISCNDAERDVNAGTPKIAPNESTTTTMHLLEVEKQKDKKNRSFRGHIIFC